MNATKVMLDRGMQTDPQPVPVPVATIPAMTSTPKKIPKPTPEMDIGFSPIKEMYTDRADASDEDYKPSDKSFAEAKEEEMEDGKLVDKEAVCEESDPVTEKKYIVFHSKLMELFESCPHCAGPSHGELVNRGSGQGTMIKVKQTCTNCSYTRTWDSQPTAGHMPLGNLMLSAAILFSGSQVSQVLRLFDILNLQSYSRSTFQTHQKDYVIPTVINSWSEDQVQMMAEMREIEGGLQLAGDCRNDSPGHSAKYGTYTLIEQTTTKVIDVQLVQVITSCTY